MISQVASVKRLRHLCLFSVILAIALLVFFGESYSPFSYVLSAAAVFLAGISFGELKETEILREYIARAWEQDVDIGRLAEVVHSRSGRNFDPQFEISFKVLILLLLFSCFFILL